MENEAYRRGYESEGNPYVSWLNNPYKDKSLEACLWVDGKVQAIIDIREGKYEHGL